MITASGYDIGTAPTHDLEDFAGTVADHIRSGVMSLPIAMDVLHTTALELNRRYGAASEQTAARVNAAIETLVATYVITWDADMPLSHDFYTQVARALGVMLDKGKAAAWRALHWDTEYTRESATAALWNLAVQEGLARGFRHEEPPAGAFFPEDAVAPF